MRPHPTIYFIRHGETDWNAARRYQGQADVPLNETGRAQARRNGQALRVLLPGIAQAHFVASPLGRTLETMRIVRNELGLVPGDFSVDPRLIELNYGHWEGQLASDLPSTDPEGLAARAADPYHWRPQGGENYLDLTHRLECWLADLTGPSVVVSHGGVSRALRGLLITNVRPEDIALLDVPQDQILHFEGGEIRWF
ncbi:MAG: histidine phosphatase family protein [Hyphomicrobiaceae bacterium]